MAKYHISPNSGHANICHAEKKPCPIGGVDEHYSTREEAIAAREEKLREEFSENLSGRKRAEGKQNNTLARPAQKGDYVAAVIPAYGSGHMRAKVVGVRTKGGEKYALLDPGHDAPLERVSLDKVKVRPSDSGINRYLNQTGAIRTNAADIDTSDFDAEDFEMLDSATRGLENPRNFDAIDDLGITREEHAAIWTAFRLKNGFSTLKK